MFEAHAINNSQHKDLIHNVAHNYHGNRMVTCSSDQNVKVTSNFVYFTFLFIIFRQRIINILFESMGSRWAR